MIPIRQLSYVADTLLALVPRDKEFPHYSEHSFQRKLIQSAQRDRGVKLRACEPGWAYLLDKEWAAVVAAAKLTPRQKEVFLLRLTGWTFESIGQKGGHTKQGAQSIFLQAVKKITRSMDSYPYLGLADVYRQENRRGR